MPIWREIPPFEVTEQRLPDQARAIRTNEWLTDVELVEIRRKILTHRDGEENQENNNIPVIEERIQNENSTMDPNETEICVPAETKNTDQKVLSFMS